MILKRIYQNARQHFELIVWTIGLVLLYLMQPSDTGSLCIYKALGFSFCPGCGIGHSIHYLLHGQLQFSIKSHPLGVLALPIIISRIITLIKNHFQLKTNITNELISTLRH